MKFPEAPALARLTGLTRETLLAADARREMIELGVDGERPSHKDVDLLCEVRQ